MPLRDTLAREVLSHDNMDSIYMMGFDVWRGTLDTEGYLGSCRESKKYQRGAWFVLEVEGALVSSMIVYNDGFALPANSLGFGSIATHPQCRGQGYGSALIRGLLGKPSCRSASAIYLHADIAPSFYEQFGFVPLRASRAGAMCMMRSAAGTRPSTPIPDYF